jgi:hypothetical protein
MPGVTARPEDILKSLSPAADLQQVETQGAAPVVTESESTGALQHPRRRRASGVPSTQMELMQVETSTPAEPASAPAEGSEQRAHGPGRRRRSGAPIPAGEPLVQVETGQNNI